MAQEHSTIADPNIHEPKGIAAAPIDSVYVASGTGTGAWTTPGGALFGDMDFSSNAVDTSISVASPTVGDGNAVLLSGATLTTPAPLYTQGVADTITFENTLNNELLRVPESGIYEVSFNCSFTGGGGGAGNIYRFNFAINGVESTTHAYSLRQTASADVGSTGFSEYITLSANDTIQPTVANQSGTNNPTVLVSSFTLILVKAT
jgi:hypothetical protein